MKKQNLYTVEWLDDYGEPYERFEDLTYKQMVHYRQEAKYILHTELNIIKQQ